jgi:2-oxoglutarate dehydrogenase E2 component (dihydrolipoamide succinyltransferase)
LRPPWPHDGLQEKDAAMSVEIKVPSLGESITEATVARWFRSPGDSVTADEPLVTLETDKVAIEVHAPASGRLERIAAGPGATVKINSLLGAIAEGEEAARPAAKTKPARLLTAAARRPHEPPPPAALSPAVRRLVSEAKVDPAAVPASGRGGRLVKADVLTYIDKTVGETPSAPASLAPNEPESRPEARPEARPAHAREERVRMTRLRRTVGERLREAQRTAAMLTTFNEVDMSAVMALRTKYQDEYQSRHGVKLGFMSFFVRAVVVALRDVPSVNAQIDGEDIVYKNHYDIGVAVSAPQGLVVPVVRDADALHFADIEKRIADLAKRARDGRLTLDEIQGGTFTITNGGVFGSLLSTPILNPPQSGILGMHKIENRPVALGDQVVVRPMMYLALTYDHRLVDGREAVTFLVRVKECVEVPDRLLLDL